MWGRIRALIVKEFLAVWKDKKSRAVIIVPPLLQLLVFGYAATFDVNHVATAIYNEDSGCAARELVARFEGSPTFDIVARLSPRGGHPEGHRPEARQPRHPYRPDLLARPDRPPAGRGAAHRRRPGIQHRADHPGLRQPDHRRLQQRMARDAMARRRRRRSWWCAPGSIPISKAGGSSCRASSRC